MRVSAAEARSLALAKIELAKSDEAIAAKVLAKIPARGGTVSVSGAERGALQAVSGRWQRALDDMPQGDVPANVRAALRAMDDIARRASGAGH